MRKNYIFTLIILLSACLLVGCSTSGSNSDGNKKMDYQEEGNARIQECNRYLKQFTAKGEAVNQYWQQEVKEIFGPGCGCKIASNVAQVESYQAEVKCWLRVVNPEGKTVKLVQKAGISVVADGESWEARDFKLVDAPKRLKGITQALYWLAYVMVGPLLIFLAIAILLNYITLSFISNEKAFGCARWGTGILVLPWVGITSSMMYGTTLAFWMGMFIYVLLYLLTVNLLFGWAFHQLRKRWR